MPGIPCVGAIHCLLPYVDSCLRISRMGVANVCGMEFELFPFTCRFSNLVLGINTALFFSL